MVINFNLKLSDFGESSGLAALIDCMDFSLDSQLPSLISLFIFVWSISEANPKNNWMRGEQACLFLIGSTYIGGGQRKKTLYKGARKSHHINIKKWRKREMNAKYVIVLHIFKMRRPKSCHQLFLDGRGPVETSTRISAVHHYLHRSIYGIPFLVIFHFLIWGCE